MSDPTAWSPDQKLRADATMDDADERLAFLCFNPGPSKDYFPLWEVAKEYAAACVAENTANLERIYGPLAVENEQLKAARASQGADGKMGEPVAWRRKFHGQHHLDWTYDTEKPGMGEGWAFGGMEGDVLEPLYLAPAAPSAPPSSATCEWRNEEEDGWRTSCGHRWTFIDGGPKENGVVFCPYCGKHLCASLPEKETR